jgi:putative heme-binding domain-containing protein
VTSASEYGWRIGTGKWSASFPDNLPAVVNIGQGSPTNLLHLKDAKFPAKYRQSLLAFDWSFGIMHAIHLKPTGATYTAEREEFLSGIPLPLTDGAIGPDGALYFLTGGRRLASDLYRVYYNGAESVNSSVVSTPNQENQLRRSLEQFHGSPNPAAVNTAWPHLKHPDRFVRYAARLALEHQPVAEWQAKALAEKDPVSLTNASIALARMGKAEQKDALLTALLTINYNALSQAQQIDLFRAFELVFARMGTPETALKSKLIAYLDAHYPASAPELNQGLSKLLIHLEAPNAVSKTVALLEKQEKPGEVAGGTTATASAELIMRNPQYGLDIAKMLEKVPPVQQTYYATMLSAAKTGWTPSLREKYFAWFKRAFNYRGGLSYIGFIERARKMALANVPADKFAYYDKLSGGGLLTKSGNDIAQADYPKGPGRNWKLEEAAALFETELSNRNFKQGKAMYSAITCGRCHSIQGEGGNIGPELTTLGSRFSKKDILEAIILPNKIISDQFAATQFVLKNGQTIVGSLISQDKDAYFVSQNPFAPTNLLKILKKEVVSSKYSSVSIMLPGLINGLNEEELKDLMAYLIAGGDEKHAVFVAR